MNFKNKLKYIALFLIFSVSLFSLSGCNSNLNIDNLAFTVALGLDVGENNKIKVNFLFLAVNLQVLVLHNQIVL